MGEYEQRQAIERMRKSPHHDREVIGDGVVFLSERSARLFADAQDKDLIKLEGGWLARNRQTNKGPMPTREGDVVVYHHNQLFRVWVVTNDGAQEPDQNIAPLDLRSRAEAEDAARNWTTETEGRIFWLQRNGEWVILAE
jgi:hypothetical protein